MSAAKIVEFQDSGNTMEVFATQLHHIEQIGPCTRLVFATRRTIFRDVFDDACIYVTVPTESVLAIIGILSSKHSRFADPDHTTLN